MTVLLFCIAFGLSMDYEVFLTSRIKELHDQGADPPTPRSHGLARTGRIVSTAAGLLAVSFFAFGTSTVSFLQMFGLGSGTGHPHRRHPGPRRPGPAVMRAARQPDLVRPGPLRRVHARLALSDA